MSTFTTTSLPSTNLTPGTGGSASKGKKFTFALFDWKTRQDVGSGRFVSSTPAGAAKKAIDSLLGSDESSRKSVTKTLFLRKCDGRRSVRTVYHFTVTRSQMDAAINVVTKTGKKLSFNFNKTAEMLEKMKIDANGEPIAKNAKTTKSGSKASGKKAAAPAAKKAVAAKKKATVKVAAKPMKKVSAASKKAAPAKKAATASKKAAPAKKAAPKKR